MGRGARIATLIVAAVAAAVVGLHFSGHDSGASSATTTTTASTVPSTTAPSTDTTTTSATSTMSTTSTTGTPTSPPTSSSVTIAAVGDTELGNTPTLPSDPDDYFAPVEHALAADVVFGNLEGTMTNASTSKCGAGSTNCYAFRVPPSYAAIYRRAGFTVLNAANNHSHDFGSEGVATTSAALRGAGIVQAGLPGEIGVVRTAGVSVAFVDFAPYTNTNDLLDYATARRLILRAKRMADVVVVYMHAGAEGADAQHVTRRSEIYLGENRGNPYAFAHAAINDGANLVIASGPHVLRGLEFYRGRLIAYSLGDFANYRDFSTNGVLDLSGILHVTLTKGGTYLAARFTSVVLRGEGQAFVDPRDAAAHFVNQLSRQDFGANAALIDADGAIHTAR